MSRFFSLSALAFTLALAGQVQAQNPAGSPELVASVNLNYLKSIFDNAGVPAQINANPGEMAHVLSKIGGNPVFVIPQNCVGGDPNGDCASLSIISGIWPSSVPLTKVAEYAIRPGFAAILAGDPGTYLLRYSIIAKNGIGPKFVEGSLIQFSQEMQNFAAFLTQEERVAGGPAQPAGGFSAKPDLGALKIVNAPPSAADAALAAGGLKSN